MDIIRTENLTKIYPMGEDVYALRNVNLSVPEGAFWAVMGTSGSGKSTLMHMVGALDIPTSGKIYLEDEEISTLSDSKLSKIRREKIGFVFQDFNLLAEMTALENIVMPVLLSYRKPDEEYIRRICDLLGISDRLNHTPGEMSGGQQQRVAIARALSNNPPILLCDEPTGNLDHKSSEEVISYFCKIHKEYHKTILMVTHDEKVAAFADKILYMEDGEIRV